MASLYLRQFEPGADLLKDAEQLSDEIARILERINNDPRKRERSCASLVLAPARESRSKSSFRPRAVSSYLARPVPPQSATVR